MRQNCKGLLLVLAFLGFSITRALATVYYVGTTGNNANTPTQAQNPATPWQTVSFAVTQAANGDTIFVLPGIYTETEIVVNKRVKLLGNTLDLPVGTGVKPVFAGVSSLPNASIFIIQNTDIEIRNFNLRIDQTFVIRGIFAPAGGFARILIADNLIESTNSSGPLSSVFNSYGIQLGQLTTPASNTDSFTIVRNIIQPRNDFSSKFGRAIRVVGGYGRIGGINPSDSNRVFGDYGIQVGSISGGRVQIINNHCYGSSAAIEINFPTGNRTHLIQNNKLETWRPGLSLCLLEIKNNTISTNGNPSIIDVSNNQFIGFTRFGVFSTRSRHVHLHDNVFIPNDTTSFYAHVVINTKQQTTANDLPTPSGISIFKNDFLGNSRPDADGNVVMIQNHNSNSAPAFGNVIIGSPGNENKMAANIKRYLFLDTASGPSNTIPIWSNPSYAVSTMKPVDENFDMQHNLYDMGSGYKLPASMTKEELLNLEDKIAHKIDYDVLGFATVVPKKAFVTPASFIFNKTFEASLQRAIDVVDSPGDWEVVARAGAYPIPVNFNKSLDFHVLPTNFTAVVPELTLNTPSVTVNLTGGGITIQDQINLQDGIINLNSADVISFPGVVINGGSASSFFNTNGSGAFKYSTVTTTPVTFPVGLLTGLTSSSVYAPVTLVNNGTSDDFSLRLKSNVLSSATSGTPVDSVVGITYFFDEAVGGGSDLNLTFNWPASEEKSGLNKSSLAIQGFKGGSWNNLSSNFVAATGSNPFTATFNNVATDYSNLPVRIGNGAPTSTGNIYYVDDDTGDDTRTNAQARNPNTPWRTLAKALASVDDGDSIQVFEGTYFESNLNITKSVKLFGNVVGIGTGVGAGNGIRPVVNGNVAGPDSTIFRVNAPNVLIKNFEIPVNQNTVKYGIRARNTGWDGLELTHNRIISVGVNPNPPSDPCLRFNSFGIFLKSGGNDRYTIKSNFIEPGTLDGTICVFGRGIRIFGGHGEIGGTAPADSNRILAFYSVQIGDVKGGAVTVRNNFLVGEGLEINSPAANTGQHLVENNRFFGVFPQFFAAQMEIKNNLATGSEILVQNNQFRGFSNYGLLSTRSRNVTVTNNIFTPADTAQNFRHIGVNTKQRTISTVQPPVVNSITITGNIFNAPAGAPKGVGIEFANHNDDPGSDFAFNNITIGGVGTLANTFNGNHRYVIALDPQTGPSNNFLLFANLPVTDMAPVADNFDVQENLFNVSGGVKRPADMSLAERYELEDKILHGIDVGTLGYVTTVPNEAYVTSNSFFAPYSSSPSLQRAHDKSADGFTIFTNHENYNVPLNNAKDLTLVTNPTTRVSLPGLTLSGAGKTLLIGDTLVLVDSLKLTAGFVNLVGGTLILKDGIQINGGSNASFIRTDATPGNVWHENVAGVSKLYPIGINASYNPISLRNTGTVDNIAVRLVNDVFENGLSGAPVPSVVDKTWVITEAVPGGSELSATLRWNGSNEKSGFNRNNIFIDAYRGTWVNVSGSDPLIAAGADPYTVNSSLSGSYNNTPIRISNIPLQVGNLYYVDIVTGDDSRTNAEATNPFTPWRTLANALARVDNGDSIQVFEGVYNESNLLINKRIKLFGNVIGIGTGPGAGTGARPVINGTVSGPDSAIFRVAARNVLIQNFEIVVDQANILHGIYGRNGGYHNLEIFDNRILSAGTNPNPTTICIPFNTYAIRLIGGNGDSITIKRNIISPSAISINNCGFGRGIRLIGNHALIGGSSADSNSIAALYGVQAGDIRGGKLTIKHNQFLGGGIEVNNPAANTGQHVVERNFFDVILAPLFFSHVEVKNLQNNGTSLLINNNIFRGHAFTSIFSSRSRNVFVTNNTFIPSDTSVNYRHISVNTKQRTVSTVQPPDVPNEITITGNTFAGRTSGAEGIAIEFGNHNDNPLSETAFGNVVIGGPGALANTFLSGIKHYIALDFRSGPTSSVPVWSNLPVTQMAPVADNFDVQQNIFNVSGGNKLPAAMTDAELYELENKIIHGIDYEPLGFVTTRPNFAFVTNSSFLTPLTSTPSLQRAHNKAQDGWTINVQPDNFGEVLKVNKTLTLDAVPSDSIRVKGLAMIGTSVPVAKLTIQDPFIVTDSLVLNNVLGGKVLIGNNNFTLNATALNIGGQDSCYIVTNGNGSVVRRAVGSSQFRFNVGTISSFAPLTFTDANNTLDNFRVKVKGTQAKTDFNPSLPTQATTFVKFQWEICEDTPGGSNAQLQFDWRDNIVNVSGIASELNVVGRSTGTEWIPRVIPQVVTSSTVLNNVTEFCAPFAVYTDTLFNTILVDTVINLTNSASVNAFCVGDSMEIRYRVTRPLLFGNTFTAFLYNSANDSILLGSIIDNNTGSLRVVVPGNAINVNCAKVRLFSNTPVLVGEFSRPCIRIRRNPIPPVINVNGTLDFCVGESRTLSVGDAAAYRWYPTNQTSQSITVTLPGKYSVRITDTAGCSAQSDTVNLIRKPKPVKPVIQLVSGTNPFCAGTTIRLGIADSLSNTTYTWSPSGPIISQAGTYFLIADSTNGCRDTSAAFVANTIAAPDTFSIQVSPSNSVCEGSSITLTAPAGFTYQWAGIPGLPITSQTATVSAVGVYNPSVTITNSSNCTRQSQPLTITIRKAPTKPRIDTTLGTRYCEGTVINLSAIPFSANNTYTYTPSATFTINTNTKVAVRVDSNNCSVTSDTVLFINKPLPPAFSLTASPDTAVCAGTTVTVSGPTGLYTYLWSGVAPSPGNVQNINISAVGIYNVNLTIRDSVTKCLRTANQALTINIKRNPTTPTLTVSQGSVPFCQGDSARLAPVPFSAGNTYTYTGGGPVVTAPGTVTVRVDSANGCFSVSAPFTVVVNPLPAVPNILATPADTVCFGTSIGLTAPDGFASYLWSTGSTTSSEILSNVGTYNVTVRVTDANNCSNTSAVKQVRIKAAPAAPVIAALNGKVDFCSNDSTKIYIINANALTNYLWNVVGRLQGDTNIVKLAGQYAVAADSNGCQVNSNAITINVRPQPTPIITALRPTQFCDGDSVILSVNYTNGVSWSTGATTPSIVVKTSGIFTVTVDSLNCIATSSPVTTTSFPNPTVRAEKDTAIFGGENPTLRAVPGTTGTSPFGFEWTIRGTSDVFSTSNEVAVRPERTTVYQVLIIDANGCKASDTVRVRASKEIFVPNTFSPNGDGNNDAFKVYGFGIAEIQVRIYNRTGTLVYETNRVEDIVETAIDGNSVKGWDGKYKGKELSGETLIWHITGKLRTGEKLTIKGKNTGSVFILN